MIRALVVSCIISIHHESGCASEAPREQPQLLPSFSRKLIVLCSIRSVCSTRCWTGLNREMLVLTLHESARPNRDMCYWVNSELYLYKAELVVRNNRISGTTFCQGILATYYVLSIHRAKRFTTSQSAISSSGATS